MTATFLANIRSRIFGRVDVGSAICEMRIAVTGTAFLAAEKAAFMPTEQALGMVR